MKSIAVASRTILSGAHANIYVSSPSVMACGGMILAAFDLNYSAGLAGVFISSQIHISSDGGFSWRKVSELKIQHGRLFTAGGILYYIGHDGDIRITRSIDGGQTWSAPGDLTKGQKWHQTAANTHINNDNIYLVMERRTAQLGDAWCPCCLAPVVMRARVNSDLLDPAAWTFADELVFSNIVRGFTDNELEIDHFGIPFYPQRYPFPNNIGSGRLMHPIGWLETNIVKIFDSRHIWYDPYGRTFHLVMRAHTGLAGYAAIAKVIEHGDGRMSTTMEYAPSGKRILFMPLPGGHLRFHIIYDDQTCLYWLLGNQPYDSMQSVVCLGSEWHGLPSNDRSRLVLHFSKNLWDWCFAGILWSEKTPPASISYASMALDGEDLVVLARRGSSGAADTRETNEALFMRVPDFRNLVY